MSGGNSLVVEQASPLAPPSEHAAETEAEFIDLDAGDSLLDAKPDDGKDITGDEPSPDKETSDPEPEASGDEGEDAGEDDPDIAALLAEPDKPAKKPSGSARLKAEVAELRSEIERLQRAVPKVDEATQLASAIEREIGPAPKESDFEDYLAFQEAKTAYKTAEMLVGRELKKAAQAAQVAQKERNDSIVATFQERAEEVKGIVKDWDKVVAAATASPSHPWVAEAILTSEKGPHIAYYLSKHPEKVHQLNSLGVPEALKEIGRLEVRLTPSPKKETRAPAPVPAVKGGAKTTDVDPEKLSMSDFAAWFDQRKSGRG